MINSFNLVTFKLRDLYICMHIYIYIAKILLHITIFFKKVFKNNVQKMSTEGASDFRITTFYHNFLHKVKIIIKFRF